MSLEAAFRAIVREEIAAALATFEPKTKAAGKKAAAPESAQPAATQPPAATAPAPQPAQSPAVPTPELKVVNKITQELAGVDREAAVKILTKYGATTQREGKTIVNTSLLKPEQYQTVIDEMEERKAAIDAAATQVSLV
jgi:hypothetical protein